MRKQNNRDLFCYFLSINVQFLHGLTHLFFSRRKLEYLTSTSISVAVCVTDQYRFVCKQYHVIVSFHAKLSFFLLIPDVLQLIIMPQSFVSTTPEVFKAWLKAPHCGVRFVVKSLLKAPAPRRTTIMFNNSW